MHSYIEKAPATGRRPPLVPVAALALSLPAPLLELVPGAAPHLELERAAVARGEVWRLLSGSFVHWSPAQLLWDVAVFALLAAACELHPRCGRNRLFGAVGLSCCMISLVLLAALRGWGEVRYRGLSGVASALFALLAVTAGRTASAAGRSHGWAVTACALGLFFGKCVAETLAGRSLFAPGDYAPAPLAHLVGALSGLAVALWPRDSG